MSTSYGSFSPGFATCKFLNIIFLKFATLHLIVLEELGYAFTVNECKKCVYDKEYGFLASHE
jgi:hypothetical protein